MIQGILTAMETPAELSSHLMAEGPGHAVRPPEADNGRHGKWPCFVPRRRYHHFERGTQLLPRALFEVCDYGGQRTGGADGQAVNTGDGQQTPPKTPPRPTMHMERATPPHRDSAALSNTSSPTISDLTGASLRQAAQDQDTALLIAAISGAAQMVCAIRRIHCCRAVLSSLRVVLRWRGSQQSAARPSEGTMEPDSIGTVGAATQTSQGLPESRTSDHARTFEAVELPEPMPRTQRMEAELNYDWNCRKCKHTGIDYRALRCPRCHNSRPRHYLGKQGWRCSCGQRNHPNSIVCVLCGSLDRPLARQNQLAIMTRMLAMHRAAAHDMVNDTFNEWKSIMVNRRQCDKTVEPILHDADDKIRQGGNGSLLFQETFPFTCNLSNETAALQIAWLFKLRERLGTTRALLALRRFVDRWVTSVFTEHLQIKTPYRLRHALSTWSKRYTEKEEWILSLPDGYHPNIGDAQRWGGVSSADGLVAERARLRTRRELQPLTVGRIDAIATAASSQLPTLGPGEKPSGCAITCKGEQMAIITTDGTIQWRQSWYSNVSRRFDILKRRLGKIPTLLALGDSLTRWIRNVPYTHGATQSTEQTHTTTTNEYCAPDLRPTSASTDSVIPKVGFMHAILQKMEQTHTGSTWMNSVIEQQDLIHATIRLTEQTQTTATNEYYAPDLRPTSMNFVIPKSGFMHTMPPSDHPT